MKKLFISILSAIGLSACASIPQGAKVINNFDADRYLGTWYEVARLDHRFERGLSKVTATYSFNDNGTIRVQNRGFSASKNSWSESIGKAKFAGEKNEGKLKVSFFGPFYGAYNIVALDDDYQYALIVSNSLSYLWILSRTPSIPDEVKADYLKKATEMGFDVDALIWVEH